MMSILQRQSLYALLCLFSLGLSPYVQAKTDYTIEVFTVAGKPMTHVPSTVAVIELDAPYRLDLQLSQGLSNDEAQAAAQMIERMKQPHWKAAMDKYNDLYIGLGRAFFLGVERVPAVVMTVHSDSNAAKRYVVYGQTHVGNAIAELQQYVNHSANP